MNRCILRVAQQTLFSGLVLFVMLAGWAQAKDSDANPEATLHAQAEQAYTAGLADLMRVTQPRVGEVWLLQKILSSHPDEKLQNYVNDMVRRLATDPFVRLIHPAAVPPNLPEDPGKGLGRLGIYFMAPIGAPAERAVSFIRDYLARDETGYILTHQLLVLVWAEEAGLELPAELLAMKPKLLDKIREEHLNDPTFSDLYAERAALLMLFGAPTPEEAALWTQTTIDAQQKYPNWRGLSWTYAYDGAAQEVTGDPVHTQALALTILRLYLDKY